MSVMKFRGRQLANGKAISDLWPKIVEEENIPVEFNHEITVKI